MVEQILRSISRGISQVGEQTGQFRRAAADQNRSLGGFIKDISRMFSSQTKQQTSINSSLDDIQYQSQQTTSRVTQSNDLIQQSISLQTEMLSELRNVSGGIRSLIEGLGINGPSSGGGGGISTALTALAALGGAGAAAATLGGAGTDLMSSMTGINSSQIGGSQFSGQTTLASTNLAAEEKAILETISAGESSGAYNVVNYEAVARGSPKYFESYDQHPFKNQSGYTAAGRYQFLWNTWSDELKNMGLDPETVSFSPENQDKVAISHAKNIYKQKTGRDLIEDIKNPQLHQSITNTLRPTWHGIEDGSYLSSAYQSFSSQQAPEGDGDVLAMNGPVDLQKYSLKPPEHVQGLDDNFEAKLGKFLSDAEAAGHSIKLNSGYRSVERQQELWQSALQRYGSPDAARRWVAPPGRSRHNYGLAADLKYETPGAEDWAHQNAAKYGLNFRMGHEPWHIEPNDAGTQIASGASSSGTGAFDLTGSGSSLGITGQSPMGLTGIGGFDQMITSLMGLGGIAGPLAMLSQAGMGIISSISGISMANMASADASAAQQPQQEGSTEQPSLEPDGGEEGETMEGDGDVLKLIPPEDIRPEMISRNAEELQLAQLASLPVSDKTQAGDAQGPTGYTTAAGNMSLNGLKDTTLPDWYRSLFGAYGGNVVPDSEFYKTFA